MFVSSSHLARVSFKMFNRYIVLVLFLCMRSAWSIRCYECNSQNNTMCMDPTIYDQDTLTKFLPAVTCGQGVVSANNHGFFCRKIVQTILHKGYQPDVRVTRSCGWVRHHKDCYTADNEDHLETVCQCFTEGCNGAASATFSLLAMATVAVVMV